MANRQWMVPTGLILLSTVPVVAGGVRVSELATGAATADDARFFDMPAPVIVHIVGATVYCLLGAFQFASGFRRRRPRWHRIAGRILIPSGIAVALSGIWMTLFYDLPPTDGGELLTVYRLGFGLTMAVSIVVGFVAVRRRDFSAHRAWMIRGYAIGQGAGTQVFTLAPVTITVGYPGEFAYSMLMLAGWVINVVAAEWIIRRRS